MITTSTCSGKSGFELNPRIFLVAAATEAKWGRRKAGADAAVVSRH
jgi:hypothetical protein